LHHEIAVELSLKVKIPRLGIQVLASYVDSENGLWKGLEGVEDLLLVFDLLLCGLNADPKLLDDINSH
jgi:hypothetical protein